MKLCVIALDYDGTIATSNGVDQAVRAMIADARTAGVLVFLVTGRRLDDLSRVAGDLHFLDCVVAENGAVVYFPDSGYRSVLAPHVAQTLTAELARRGISFAAGECLVDAAADDATSILQVIRTLELPLVLAFNRGRVMTLPQGVSKSTGLRTALTMVRRSARNTIAVGDAENDHELLRLAEVGAAVEWGSTSLRASADVVIPGSGPPAVAAYLETLLLTRRLPRPASTRRRLLLGYLEDGREFSLAARGRNVLVAGDPKSGKSWLGGLLVEQLILHGYSTCVLDPEGDYRSLEALPGVNVLGGDMLPPSPRELARALRYPDQSLIVDLSRLSHFDKVAYIRSALPALNVIRRRTGFPHRIVLDEAHYFLHERDAYNLLDLELNGYIVMTFCASRLPPEVLAATEVMLVTCESNPAEVDALYQAWSREPGGNAEWKHRLGHLRCGQAVALPVTEESKGELQLFTIGQRITQHVRHREKYVDVPVTEPRAFVFGGTRGASRRARTLREFVRELEMAPRDSLQSYLRRGDFSRWVRDVFGDQGLADEIRLHEERFTNGLDADAVPEIVAAVRGRYDLEPAERSALTAVAT